MKSTAQNPNNANFKSIAGKERTNWKNINSKDILVKYKKGWTNGQIEKYFNKMNSKKLYS